MNPPSGAHAPGEDRDAPEDSRVPESATLAVTPSLRIPLSELHFRFAPSGGPGGQRANKVSTRVEVRFDVVGSPSLGSRQRARLKERFGPEIRVVADDERSQSRNRALAVERLRQRMADALRVVPPRRPTRPSRSANERRLAAKRRTAERKQNRRPGSDD
jgi:ribosome-associated protein